MVYRFETRCVRCGISFFYSTKNKRRIKKYCSNVCRYADHADRRRGKPLSLKTCEAISQANKGRVISQRHREIVSQARKRCVGPLNHNWNPDREEQLARHKTSRLMYGLLGRILARSSFEKMGHTDEQLGYSAAELRSHIESLWQPGMSWENHGKGGWHLDHVRPVCTFPVDALPSEVNALSNLQPLWEKENLSKNKIRWSNK